MLLDALSRVEGAAKHESDDAFLTRLIEVASTVLGACAVVHGSNLMSIIDVPTPDGKNTAIFSITVKLEEMRPADAPTKKSH